MQRRCLNRRSVIALALFAVAARGPARSFAQGLDYVKANYTKYEYRIPMRDGMRLFTAVYVPKDDRNLPDHAVAHAVQRRALRRRQYKTDLGPSPLFGKDGYIFVYQDVRGRCMSEGEFVNMRPHIARTRTAPQDIDESSDTYDTIDWLVKNVPSNNGKVGHVGHLVSGLLHGGRHDRRPPGAEGGVAAGAVTDWFVGDDLHHNGALFLPHAFNFMSHFGQPRPEPTKKSRAPTFDHGTPDGYDFFLQTGAARRMPTRGTSRAKSPFWNEMMQHGTYDDFWKARNLRPHLKNIKPAVMTVGGWFDAENLFGALETYQARREAAARAPATCW